MATRQNKEILNSNFNIPEIIKKVTILNEGGNGLVLKFYGPR